MSSISIVGLAGEVERLDLSAEERVSEVRCRLANMFGHPMKLVQLFMGAEMLQDDLLVGDAVRKATRVVADHEAKPQGVFSVSDPLEQLDDPIVINVHKIYDYSKHVIKYGETSRWSDFKGAKGKGKGRGKAARDAPQGFLRLGNVSFPTPNDININMMPFIIGDPASIPQEYRQYEELLRRCQGYNCSSEQGKIGYLTIQESLVHGGESQRRPGLHLEAPGLVTISGGKNVIQIEFESHWGRGDIDFYPVDKMQGGIYMASTLSDSCRVWNARIDKPCDVVGHLGDVEHLRDFLDAGTNMKKNELFWITDVTPHESLPLKEDQYRQYFRFVTSGVTVWYEKHSTKNRLGIEPDPRMTQIISEDKFATERCMYCNPAWTGWYCSYCGESVAPVSTS